MASELETLQSIERSGDLNPYQKEQLAKLRNSGSSGNEQGVIGAGVNPGGFEDTIRRAIEMSRAANKPAVDSLEASIPEQSAKFNTQRTQLEAEKQPLKDRYASLLEQIKGNQKTAENRQTVTTQNELGKRGLLPESGLAQQELTNAVNPITLQYTGLTKDTGLAQEADLRDIGNQITSSYDKETEANRAIKNAIAQLMSGAANTGIQTGSNIYQFNEGQAQQRRLAEQAAAAAERQNAIDNEIKRAQLELATKETNYATGKPYYEPKTTASAITSQFNSGFIPTAPKPTTKPSTTVPKTFKPLSTSYAQPRSYA